MASMQRRRGEEITLYAPKEVTDRRGNRVLIPQGEAVTIRCAETFDRSNRAEVPGQQSVEQISVILSRDVDAQLWTVAYFRDAWWDVSAPPAQRRGNRHTRHQTAILRRRPGSMGLRFDGEG